MFLSAGGSTQFFTKKVHFYCITEREEIESMKRCIALHFNQQVLRHHNTTHNQTIIWHKKANIFIQRLAL